MIAKKSEPPPDKLSKDILKDMRKEKLEQLALKEKEAKKEEEKPRQPVQTKQVPKIKQSVPKTAKLLEPLENVSIPKKPLESVSKPKKTALESVHLPKKTKVLGPLEAVPKQKAVQRPAFENQLSLPDGLPKKKVMFKDFF